MEFEKCTIMSGFCRSGYKYGFTKDGFTNLYGHKTIKLDPCFKNESLAQNHHLRIQHTYILLWKLAEH